MVKVLILGIAGSPRHGNTDILVKEALKAAKELPDVETEFYSLAHKKIAPCNACCRCLYEGTKDKACPAITDDFDELWPKMSKADGFIIGSPVYYGAVTAQLKAVIDRCMSLELNPEIGPNGLRNKVVGVITVATDRAGGHEGAIFEVIRWALTEDMIPVSVGPDRPLSGIGSYWGVSACTAFHAGSPEIEWSAYGAPEELTAVRKDKIGMTVVKLLAKRVTEMAKVVKAGFSAVSEHERIWPLGPAGGYVKL